MCNSVKYRVRLKSIYLIMGHSIGQAADGSIEMDIVLLTNPTNLILKG